MSTQTHHSGTLFVVATPLGNLGDITLRAVEILREAGAVACEDTRRTSILLKHLGIEGKKLLSYHSHNEAQAINRVAALLEEGVQVALVTDAGTPVISDPGYGMLRALHERGIAAIPVPGPSALTAVLSVCPLPSSSFYFAGFLPHKKGRKSRLEQLAAMDATFVLYESPFRIHKLLDELEALIPDAEVFIGREMTKMHEEYLCGTIPEMRRALNESKTRGEFVVAVHPPERKKNPKKTDRYADHH
ncbi:16S rRNA (cytidine(1402)-2'-O)-methyltransferase [Chlorobium sp. N1]|uniref:16S rRNA (cytidine(1402)-2'-O)-methyltransferase n=1 Tax=Chlorobium sp. N1 TaxID=2491138 RepID=UPI00103982BD|nr:16S rRNA (cytidine(1402)-2'-O)-methyltransferase [Chlorobium sp. N1]TCD48758.1 16S rRNA (cytidine(1402)-2'-O)-methyltransferase [Chlorobium sp. N1]